MCRATNEFREDHSMSYSMTFQVLQSSRFCTSYPDPCVIRELQENVQSDPMLSTPSSTGESMTRCYANHCSSIYAQSDQCFSDPIVPVRRLHPGFVPLVHGIAANAVGQVNTMPRCTACGCQSERLVQTL